MSRLATTSGLSVDAADSSRYSIAGRRLANNARCLRSPRMACSGRSGRDRACVKTQKYPVFGYRFTLPKSLPSKHSATEGPISLRTLFKLRFHAGSTRSGQSGPGLEYVHLQLASSHSG